MWKEIFIFSEVINQKLVPEVANMWQDKCTIEYAQNLSCT